jgi:sortase (surface protein transpeptidase)
VKDALPSGLSYQASVPSQGSYDPSSGVWSVGTLGSGSTATLLVKALVSQPGRIVNTARIQPGAWLDPSSGNDAATGAVDAQTLPAPPDTGVAPAEPAAPALPFGQGLLAAWLLSLAALVWAIGLFAGRRTAGGAWGERPRLLVAALTMLLVSAPLLQLAAQNLDHAAPASGGLRPEISDRQLFGKSISQVPTKPQASSSGHVARGPVVPSRLRIPSLGIDVNVEPVGISRSGAMDVPGNLWNAGWLDTGPRPGAPGQAVLDGHKNSVHGPGLFNDLAQLRVGDRVYVSDPTGGELTFEVTRTMSYPLSGFPSSEVFGAVASSQLNLITCVGGYSTQAHTYDHRLVVFTRLLPGTPSA